MGDLLTTNSRVCKILICDDDAIMGRVIGDTLVSSFPSETVVTRNAFDAVATLKREKFDILVTDILLPRMDGIELIIETRRLDFPPKIVAYSGGGSLGKFAGGPSFLEIARALGADWAFPRQDVTTALVNLAVQGQLTPGRDGPSADEQTPGA